jgi:multidrug resistance efflux pump
MARRVALWLTVCGCLGLAGYLWLDQVGLSAQPNGPGSLTRRFHPQVSALEQAASSAAEKKEAISVERGPFSVTATVKGILVGTETVPVTLHLETWKPDLGGSPPVIQKVVPHGTQVKKGDPILWLDTSKISDAIRELEASQKLARVAIEIAEKEVPLLEQSVPLELSAAERAKKEADEDLERFRTEDRPFLERDADEDVKYARVSLEFAEEELKQLEKMYKADDLVEETERIILKRQQALVDLYKWMLATFEKRRRDLLRFELPRRELALREGVEKTTIASAKARSTLALAAEKKRLELEKLKQDYAKNEDRLAKLKRDRDAMAAVLAPAEGFVYYGRFLGARWIDVETAQNQLQPGFVLPPPNLPLTIVSSKELQIVAEVGEKDLEHVQAARQGRGRLTAYPDKRVTAQVLSVSPQPAAPGKFLARLALRSQPDNPSLVPGMSCEVKFVTYSQPQAISLPKEAVWEDDTEPDRFYVWVLGPDGKTTKRAVKTGRSNESHIEILEGLQAGEKVVPPDRLSRTSGADKETQP